MDRAPDTVNFNHVCDPYGVFASIRATVCRFVSSVPGVAMNLKIKPMKNKSLMTVISGSE